MAWDSPRSWRPVVMGRRGAVASNHPLATQAGLLALQAGGDAVDAAVAVAATLSVVEPMMSGLGGDGFYHVYRRATGEGLVWNGTGPAPRAATPERYAGGLPMTGPLSASVPGSVGAWGAMHVRFGRRPWAGLLEPAVTYAREGFGATRAYRHFAGDHAAVGRYDDAVLVIAASAVAGEHIGEVQAFAQRQPPSRRALVEIRYLSLVCRPGECQRIAVRHTEPQSHERPWRHTLDAGAVKNRGQAA
jgi:hypothetical protein